MEGLVAAERALILSRTHSIRMGLPSAALAHSRTPCSAPAAGAHDPSGRDEMRRHLPAISARARACTKVYDPPEAAAKRMDGGFADRGGKVRRCNNLLTLSPTLR